MILQKAGKNIATGLALKSLLLLMLATPVTTIVHAPAYAESQNAAVAVGARLGGDLRRTRFVTDVSRPIEFSVTLLADPYRVIIDMPDVIFKLPAGLGAKGRGLVQAYRYGQYDEGKARIVLDTKGPVKVAKSFIIRPVNNQPARLVLDLEPIDAISFQTARDAEATASKASDASSEIANPEDEAVSVDIDALIKRLQRSVYEAAKPAPPSKEISELAASEPPLTPTIKPKPKPAETKSTNLVLPKAKPVIGPNSTISRKRVRKKHQVIILDPGHGGVDPGAIGRRGTPEKKVTLAFAKILAAHLRKSNRYKVYLTRSGDRFIRLRDRVHFARKKGADLFIAIHADSIRRGKVQGATVYTLSERASDKEAGELAAKENRADIIAGVDLGVETAQVTGILIDLAQRETNNHSTSFAQTLARQLSTTTKLTRKPLRSAGFRVLKAPDVPSVLLELGYLSSRKDEMNLRSAAWRKKVAGAVAGAIDAYFAKSLAQSGN
ncbi:MAG: N-acetylmuramoyl-L-alanine amidase [Hyphomicrobiales bacterium]